MAQLSFNAQNVAPQQSAAPIPAGVYLAHVIDSDVRPLKSGNGTGLSLTFEVLQGPYARRKVFASLNVKHSNPEAERIGQSQLSAVCHAAGVIQVADTQQLHMRPVMIRVKIRKDESGQYEDRNEVNGYEAAQQGGGMPQAGMFPAAAAAQQPVQQAAHQQAFQAPPAMAPAPAPIVPAAAPWARRTASA